MKSLKSDTPCPKCGSVRLISVTRESGPHHAQLRCRRCTRFHGWAPAPMTPERAAATELHIGKFAGCRLDHVASIPEGRDYLHWLAGQAWPSGRLKQALPIVLASPAHAEVSSASESSGRQTARRARKLRNREE